MLETGFEKTDEKQTIFKLVRKSTTLLGIAYQWRPGIFVVASTSRVDIPWRHAFNFHDSITSRARRIDQSFLQTIMILPIVVTGISMIVLNSLALAFSLAGVVAAVRFRFSLNQPSDAMYIFVAIAIGLGCGIGAVGVAGVISLAFALATLVIWRLEYGKTLAGRFLTMITRRDHGEEEYEDK